VGISVEILLVLSKLSLSCHLVRAAKKPIFAAFGNVRLDEEAYVLALARVVTALAEF